MTKDDWMRVPAGTRVRYWPGGQRTTSSSYCDTVTKRAPYWVQGEVWVRLKGQDAATPVAHIDLLPEPEPATGP